MDHRLMWVAVFVVGHAAVAHFEHVGIVPVAGLGEWGERVLREADGGHGIPGVADVAGGAPGVAADFRSPLPNIGAAVLAKTVEDGAAGFEKSIAHFLINGLHFFIGVEVAGAAPIVF